MKKEGRKKQARSYKQSREIQHTYGSHFPKGKMSCLRWDLNPQHVHVHIHVHVGISGEQNHDDIKMFMARNPVDEYNKKSMKLNEGTSLLCTYAVHRMMQWFVHVV